MRIACLLDRRAHRMPTPLLKSVFARLERPDGPVVVDINYFPGCLVTDDELVADYLEPLAASA
jgi:gluconate kinase